MGAKFSYSCNADSGGIKKKPFFRSNKKILLSQITKIVISAVVSGTFEVGFRSTTVLVPYRG